MVWMEDPIINPYEVGANDIDNKMGDLAGVNLTRPFPRDWSPTHFAAHLKAAIACLEAKHSSSDEDALPLLTSLNGVVVRTTRGGGGYPATLRGGEGERKREKLS